MGPADDQDEAVALHPDQHIGGHVAGRTTQAVDVEHLGSRAHENADLAVPVPAERRDPAGQFVVVLAAQNRVHDEGLQTHVPEAACLRCPGVDIRRAEGDLAGIQQDGLAQHLPTVLDPLLHHLDGDANQLQGLLQADRAQQLTRGGTEDVGRDPRSRPRVVEPGNERCDPGLRDQSHGGSPPWRHVAVPGQRVLETFQRRRRQFTRNRAQPAERLFLRLRCRCHGGC